MLFKLYKNKPNAIKYGKLYTASLSVSFSSSKRTIRVFTPDNYDKNREKPYKVIFVADGQNIVDKYTTAYGEWNYDEVLHKLAKEGYEDLIVVGIDCPKDEYKRAVELSPPYKAKYSFLKNKSDVGIANKFIDYIFDELIYTIKDEFNISLKREDVAIGGSSMGGIMSFYAYFYRKKDIGFALSFSPAFLIFNRKDIIKNLKQFKPNIEDYGKLFFFVGGEGFEEEFVKDTLYVFDYLRKQGFDNSQMRLIFDSIRIHNESSWERYLPDALRFFLQK